jgi:hypothetical protein
VLAVREDTAAAESYLYLHFGDSPSCASVVSD